MVHRAVSHVPVDLHAHRADLEENIPGQPWKFGIPRTETPLFAIVFPLLLQQFGLLTVPLSVNPNTTIGKIDANEGYSNTAKIPEFTG